MEDILTTRRYTRLPRCADCRVLQGFVRLFEDVLYIRAMRNFPEMDDDLQDSILDAYISLLECERLYKHWLKAMAELGQRYVKPLMNVMLADEILQQKILRQQDKLSAALLAADQVQSVLMRYPSLATNTCLGRSAEVAQRSRRFQRQYTL